MSAYHLYENPVIPGKIQMEQFIPVECFRGKNGCTFECITFFSPAFTVTTETFCTFVLDYESQTFSGEKAKNLPYFVNDTTQCDFCFRCEKKYIPVLFGGQFSPKFW